MSFELTRLAWAARDLKPSEKLVLLYAADIARTEHGNRMWARQSTIAEFCGLNAHTVKIALKALTEKGHLKRTIRPSHTTVFVVLPDIVAVDITPGGVNSTGYNLHRPSGENDTAPPVEIPPVTRCELHLRTINEPLNDPSSKPIPPTGGAGLALKEMYKAEERVFATEILALTQAAGMGAQRKLANRSQLREQRVSRWLKGHINLKPGEKNRVRVALQQMQERGELHPETSAPDLRIALNTWLKGKPRGAESRLCEQIGIRVGLLSNFKLGNSDLTPANRAKIAAVVLVDAKDER